MAQQMPICRLTGLRGDDCVGTTALPKRRLSSEDKLRRRGEGEGVTIPGWRCGRPQTLESGITDSPANGHTAAESTPAAGGERERGGETSSEGHISVGTAPCRVLTILCSWPLSTTSQ